MRRATFTLTVLLAGCPKPADDAAAPPIADDLADGADPTSPTRDEDCARPGDEDGNGLADCEDAACADACTEDCAAPGDEDADGWEGCQDDDCWGPACPPDAVVAWVTAGTLRREATLIVNDSADTYCNDWRSLDEHLIVTSPTGQVAVDHGGRWTTCAWSAERGSVEHHHSVSDVFTSGGPSPWGSGYSSGTCTETVHDVVSPLTRAGATVDPACGLSASEFLPRAWIPRARPGVVAGVAEGGVGWYVASVTWTAASVAGFRQYQTSVGPLTPGDPVHTCAAGAPVPYADGWRCP